MAQRGGGRKVRWSNLEVGLLKKLYPVFRVKKLADKFPNRTKATIVARALALGLPSAKLWQPEENNALRKHFINSPKETIQKLLPKRSWSATMAQAERLGLKRKTDKPRRDVDEDYFKKWSPNMAYVLGFIFADGCIVRGTYAGYSDSLKFGVQVKDVDILEKIKRELKSKHSISIVKNAAHFSIASQKIVDDLKSLGISYRKSLRERIPNVPEKFIKDFIRGIVDGDGSLWLDQRNYPTLSITGGKNILDFIREHFFKKFHLHSALVKQSYSEKIKRNLYQISYRCSSAQTLIKYIYNDHGLFLNRKFKTALRCLNSVIKARDNDNYRLKKYYETHTG